MRERTFLKRLGHKVREVHDALAVPPVGRRRLKGVHPKHKLVQHDTGAELAVAVLEHVRLGAGLGQLLDVALVVRAVRAAVHLTRAHEVLQEHALCPWVQQQAVKVEGSVVEPGAVRGYLAHLNRNVQALQRGEPLNPRRCSVLVKHVPQGRIPGFGSQHNVHLLGVD